jgi:DNA-binding transcriptional ArsR family regulator
MTSHVELILHPVRMRIIATITGQQMTAQRIAQAMPDLSQTSLYRHLNTLVEGGILTVVAENPVRGTLEKVYALAKPVIRLGQNELADATKDDHMRYFMIFLSTLLQEFSQYLERTENIHVGEFAYNTIPLYLTDGEVEQLREQFQQLFAPYLNRELPPESRRYLLSSIIIPDE